MGELFQFDSYYMEINGKETDMSFNDMIQGKMWDYIMREEKPEQSELCKMYKQMHVNKHVFMTAV